jgi:CheY-like chemotaxis protein/cytidylate kinase
MSIISIFGGDYCKRDELVQQILDRTGRRHYTDQDILARASELGEMPAHKIERAFTAKTSVFNKFTHEKERSLAYLRLAVARIIQEDNIIVSGFAGQLIPNSIAHVVRVCLVADMKFRIAQLMETEGVSEKEALKRIHKTDEDRAAWISSLFGQNDPWQASLYDIMLPTDKMTMDEALGLILKYSDESILKTTASSRQAANDFLLAAEVGLVLARAGHDVEVTAKNGEVTLTINKNVFMLQRLEEELKALAGPVPGLKSVSTKVGKGFHQTDVYRRYDFEVPSKVLLVDDEREFAQTLSERLVMREMGSTVAYDGESALDLIREDEPEVMILDLKMPGIDGIEVLRRVKLTNPEVEVIILTGQGSEADRKTCLELGAFAYLQKPVDIDQLSQTLKSAYEKNRRRQAR